MEKTFPCILLLLIWSLASSKYVHIAKKINWHKAQEYCRKHHADLAHVSNQNDNQRLQKKNTDKSWFGLQRDLTSNDKWRWSGGGEVSVFYWGKDQPNHQSGEDFSRLFKDGWHDSRPSGKAEFLCFSPIVVKTRKTWEEAMGYCRRHHLDLASLLSETEMMLIGKVLFKSQVTEPVWIGLHFFSGEWLWVDGETSEYQGWGEGGGPSCPHPLQVCAVLRMKPNSTTAASTENNPASVDSEGVPNEWEAHNCGVRLPFICY